MGMAKSYQRMGVSEATRLKFFKFLADRISLYFHYENALVDRHRVVPSRHMATHYIYSVVRLLL